MGAVDLHKSKEKGHTIITYPIHCLKRRTRWQDPEQKTGFSRQNPPEQLQEASNTTEQQEIAAQASPGPVMVKD